MNRMERGDILKLSEAGLNWIYHNDARRERAKELRFEYQGIPKRDLECINVRQLPKRYWRIYHNTFLELA